MKSKGIPELPKIKLNGLSNVSSNQQRQSNLDNSYLVQYPQSIRNSFQNPYWNSQNLNQNNHYNSQEEQLSHRQFSNQFEEDQRNVHIPTDSRKNSQNYSPEITQSARSSSVIIDNPSQNKYKYYRQAQKNLNGQHRNNEFHGQKFRCSITPQSQSFTQDNHSQEGETRTYFYTNNQQRHKKVTQSHQQGFYPPDNLSEEREYNNQTGPQYLEKTDQNVASQSDRQADISLEKQRDSNDAIPRLESTTLYNQNKTYFPKTTENYKFFLNSALKDIHGIYSKNQQLDKSNQEKFRHRSTSKSQATQENFFEPRKRLNSISNNQKQSSQEYYFTQTKQQYVQPGDQLKRNEPPILKNTNYSELNQLNYVTLSTKNSQKRYQQQKNYENNLNHQYLEQDINYGSQLNNNRASVDLGQIKKNTNYEFFMKETNQNHLRKNFHSKRIEELSKPKQVSVKPTHPQEKTQSQVQKKRKQSPQRIQSEKSSSNNLVLNKTEGTQRLATQNAKNQKEKTKSISSSLVKDNNSIMKSDGKDKSKMETTQANSETQNLVDSKVFDNDSFNEEIEIDSSFERLQKTIKKQNEVQEKLSQNTKNATQNLTSIDKIRILTGKGKFHFSKKQSQDQQQGQQNNLQQTKDFLRQQRIAQIRNDKIERILSLKNSDNIKHSLESGFSSQSFGKMEINGSINLFNLNSQGERFQQNLSRFQSSCLFRADKKLKNTKVEFKVNYGFKLDKEIEFYKKQREQKEQKEKEESQQKQKQQKEIVSKQIYQRERHRNLEVDITIHSEEIHTKLVFGEKVSFIKIPVVTLAEELDIQYIQPIDQFSTLCRSQKQMKGAQFILRKEKLTELKQQHYLFHINSLMAKENNLYVKDPVAVRVDSEYYLLQFYKVYRKLKDVLLMQNSQSLQSKLYPQHKFSNYGDEDYSITNQENEEEEVRDQPFLNESQIAHIYKQILENVTQMNEILNIFHSNLNLDNIALFEGNCVSIINFDETQIIYNKGSNQQMSNKNYIISNNNLQRIQYQKYVQYEEILSKEFSPLDYQLHDLICLFIQLKFANPDLMSESQFKQFIKIINLEQPLSLSGQVIKQLIQYQQLQQHNLIQSYADTIYIDKHGYGMDYLISYKYQKQDNNNIDQILFYLTNLQFQKSNQMINCLSQQQSSEQLILRAFYYYLNKQYEISYEELLQFEKESLEKYHKEQIQNNQNLDQKDKESLQTNTINNQILQSLHFWKGRIEFMNKQFDKSDKSFQKYINGSQNICNSLLDLADFYKHIVNLNKSIHYYEQAEKHVVNNKELNLHQIYYVQIMKRQIYFYQNTDIKEKQIEIASRCIQFLTQTYKDEQDCELLSFKQQFSNLITQQPPAKKQ